MNAVTRTIGRVLFLLTVGFGVIGCQSSPHMQAHDVTVALANEGTTGSDTYTVDLVGVSSNDTELAAMRSMDISEYWANGARRKTLSKTTFTFKAGSTGAQTLPLSDKQWKTWEGEYVMNLFVIADLPEATAGKSGNQDLRRVEIPLDSRQWDGAQKIRVELTRSTIKYTPIAKPLPPKK